MSNGYSGINLHHLVRQPINAIHPDQDIIYFRGDGQTDRVAGVAQPIYTRFEWMAQIQSESDKGQYQSNRSNENSSIRNVYLYALPGREKPAAIIRPMSRVPWRRKPYRASIRHRKTWCAA